MSNNSNSLWVFGYGSLCWRPGFEFGDSVVGHVNGFARKFWQGNTTHRGTPEKPGRVATLIEEKNTKTYGVAFRLVNESALNYLNNREVTLGGYVSHITMFHPRDSTRGPMPVLLYVATPTNQHWLGSATCEQISKQVVTSRGDKGHNVEYVLKLAEWMRKTLPDARDDHLFDIEKHVRAKVDAEGLCLNSLMGDNCHNDGNVGSSDDEQNETDDRIRRQKCGEAFSSQVKPKCLRCVKM